MSNDSELLGKIVNIKGAMSPDNTPIDIEIKSIVDCYNRALVIINSVYVVTYAELYELKEKEFK